MKSITKQFDLSFMVAFAIMVVFAFTTIVVVAAPINHNEYVEVTVETGDTLWGMANKYSGSYSFSKKEFITWVIEQNGMTGFDIYPGDKLVIPVKK